MGGWVGGLTLTIKLISAQLNYAAAGAGPKILAPMDYGGIFLLCLIDETTLFYHKKHIKFPPTTTLKQLPQ